MSPWMLYAAAGVGVSAAGLLGAFDGAASYVRRTLAVNVVGTGVFLLFIATARRASTVDPDFVPHALVLTGVVVSVSGTALALTLARRLADDADPEARAPDADTSDAPSSANDQG